MAPYRRSPTNGLPLGLVRYILREARVAYLAAKAAAREEKTPGREGGATGLQRGELCEHFDARLRTSEVNRTTDQAPLLEEGCELVFVGYDPSTGEYAALEIVDGSWHNSRFAPQRFRRRAKRGKTKRTRPTNGGDQTSAPEDLAQRPAMPSRPVITSSARDAAGPSQTDRAPSLQSVSDIAPDLDTDVTPHTRSKGPPTGGGKRGKITEFSPAQRRRLREHIWAAGPSQIPRRLPDGSTHYPASFVSLTYPGHSAWDDRFLDAQVCKGHLRAFWRRVERQHPGAWTIWVLELQRRSDTTLPPAWHFHLVLHWPDSQGETRAGWAERNSWLSANWAQVVAGESHPDRDHFEFGC